MEEVLPDSQIMREAEANPEHIKADYRALTVWNDKAQRDNHKGDWQ